MIKKTLFIFLIFLYPLFCYSQNNLNPGTYITKDKLGYITILPNNTFGYVYFIKTSPFIENKKKKSYVKGFLYNKKGAGIYTCDKKYINLKFTESDNLIDSLKIETKPNLTDSIIITLLPIYNSDLLGRIELTITNADLNLNLSTSEEISFKVLKDKIPLKLNLNDKNELIINDKNNYYIKVYINSFRFMNNLNLETKRFKLSKLKNLK